MQSSMIKMKTEYKEIITGNGKSAISFYVSTRKGYCAGIFAQGRIWVHGIFGKKCMKGLMSILVKRFKTNKITFTPLINDNIENTVKGKIKICPADDSDNPYNEEFKYLECEWKA